MPPTQPCFPLICAYIEGLAQDSLSPRTIQNHVSHIRTYLRKSLADTHQLDHIRVKWALDALKRNTTFVPRIKKPIPAPTLQYLVETLPTTVAGNTVKVAILVIFYAALRQSEVAAPSVGRFDHTRHLTRNDVVLEDDVAIVTVKHAKNMQTIYEQKTIRLQASHNSETCVVLAIRRMLNDVQTLSLQDPFLMLSDRRPMTVNYLQKQWRQHMIARGVDPTHFSLHSLRKAAATTAHQSGCPDLDIQKYGGWKSDSHKLYITTPQDNVNRAITESLSYK